MLKEGSGRFISKYKNGLISLLFCALALVTALLLHPIYETNDDPAMEALLFGLPGESGTSYLVFLNRILGIILLALVTVIPQINWYFVMHYAVCLTSMFVLSRTLISKFGKNGIFLSAIVTAASVETLYSVQFTKTGAIAAVAGMIGLMYALREERKNKVFAGLCIGLIIMGSMYRLEALLMVGPFLFVVFLFELIDVIKNQKAKTRVFIAVPAITLCLVLAFYLAGNLINKNTPGSDEFVRYNTYRARLTDYSYEVDSSDSSYSELLMAANWMHNDPEVFTPEKLEELSGKVEVDTNARSEKSTLELFGEYISDALIGEPMLLISLIAAVVILLFSKKKLYVPLLFCCYVFLELYMIKNGRYSLHRVDFGIHYALLMSLIYPAAVSMPKINESIKKIINYAVMPFAVIVAVLVAIWFPVNWFKSQKDYQLSCSKWMNDAVSQEGGCQYMVHPKTAATDVTRNIYDLPKEGEPAGCFYMGGWSNGVVIPGLENTSSCDIKGNPWEECIDSDTIRIVMPKDRGDYYIKIVSLYIRDHYNVKVTGVMEYQNDGVSVYRIETAS
ncbi:MAG: hypothetical protein IKF31_02690 [Clostridiales bacterium]|nr:hypothetical protein [Clostridiales bacterium]